jgi:hypothetical protein
MALGAVYLNGVSLGLTRDQFLRYSFSVSSLLTHNGSNSLEIVLLPYAHAANADARFMACSGGWDWVIRPRLRVTHGKRSGSKIVEWKPKQVAVWLIVGTI